jgi:hypothetical protein
MQIREERWGKTIRRESNWHNSRTRDSDRKSDDVGDLPVMCRLNMPHNFRLDKIFNLGLHNNYKPTVLRICFFDENKHFVSCMAVTTGGSVGVTTDFTHMDRVVVGDV